MRGRGSGAADTLQVSIISRRTEPVLIPCGQGYIHMVSLCEPSVGDV